MWVNLRAYDADGLLLAEYNPYDEAADTLKGIGGYSYDTQDVPVPEPLLAHETHVDEWVYEMLTSSSLTGEEHTFHVALSDARFKDNRIPPQGFRILDAAERLIEPVWEGVAKADYFTNEEYAGGFDELMQAIPDGTSEVEIRVLYQTTSREYVEFLRNEINGTASTLPGPGVGGDPAYLIQTDPFFDRLRAWGDTLWSLWVHNRDIAGAAPIEVAEAEFSVCTPLLLTGTTAGVHSYQGCPVITIGPGWEMTGSATVQLRAGQRVAIHPGFRVAAGAELGITIGDIGQN